MGYLNNDANGVCYIGAVKWDIDKKDVFIPNGATKATMHNFFINTLRKINGNILFAHPNEYIDIEAKIENIEKVNYCYYKNDSEFSNTYYCCFVTDWAMVAENTTRLFLKLDVLQQYYFDATFYRSRVNRGHIKKSNDDYHRYTLAEPCFNANSLYDYNIGTFGTSSDWSPKWLAELMANRIDISQQPVLNKFECGWGSGESATSICGFYANPLTALTNIVVNFYNANEPIGNHKDEILGLSANPSWAMSGISSPSMVATNGNLPVSTVQSVNYNSNSLPNGYTPRNKKLLSSAFRVLSINNRNGYNLRVKPELITEDEGTIKISLSRALVNSAQILIRLFNYRDFNKTYSSMPYNANLPILFNSNTGTNKAMNIITGVTGIVGSVANFGTSLATLGMGVKLDDEASAMQNNLTYGTARANQASSAISAIPNLATSTLNLMTAFDAKLDSVGSGGDNTAVLASYCMLRLYDSCPSLEECQSADDFLDAYGYRLESIEAVTDYLHSRQQFNYIQTDDININLWAPANWVLEFKNIFNSGVRIWHNYDTFGNLGVSNPDA